MAVDLSELMEPARPRQRRTKLIAKLQDSIAAPVDKAAVLAMVDQLEAEDEAVRKQNVLAIAHSEEVTQWASAISEWLQTALLPVSIAELSCGLEMSWIEVWLGVLFGDFHLEQQGEFYESPICVSVPMPDNDPEANG